jgi:hypothetical protein
MSRRRLAVTSATALDHGGVGPVQQDPGRLAELVALAQRAVNEEGPGDAERRYAILYVALGWLYQQTSDVNVLRRAADAARVAAREVSSDDPFADTMAEGLAWNLAELYRVAGDLAALDEALSVSAEQVVRACTPGEYPGAQVDQLEGLLRTAEGEDVERLPGYPEAAQVYARIQVWSASAGERVVEIALERQEPELLDLAIRSLEGAMAQVVAIDRERGGQSQAYLGRAYLTRWDLAHDPHDLRSAIAILREAISALPEGQLRAWCRVSLVSAHTVRYHEADGQPGDLDAAVEVLERAAPPEADQEETRAWQGRLQAALWNRYGASADLADLDRAIEIGRSLVTDGAAAGSAGDEARWKLRQLLLARLAFRPDVLVSREVSALSAALDDTAGPDPEEGLLGWVRTYD